MWAKAADVPLLTELVVWQHNESINMPRPTALDPPRCIQL